MNDSTKQDPMPDDTPAPSAASPMPSQVIHQITDDDVIKAKDAAKAPPADVRHPA